MTSSKAVKTLAADLKERMTSGLMDEYIAAGKAVAAERGGFENRCSESYLGFE